MAWFDGLTIPSTAGGWTPDCCLDTTNREAARSRSWTTLADFAHKQEEANVESVRLRTPILKALCSAQLPALKWPHQSVRGHPASRVLSSDISSQPSPSGFTLMAWRPQTHAVGEAAAAVNIRSDPTEDLLLELYIATASLSVKGHPPHSQHQGRALHRLSFQAKQTLSAC